jgi:hypothetical protein
MNWTDFFHTLIIPFLGGFALTLLKLIADQKLLSFELSNDIALDLVLLAVGALGAFYIDQRTVGKVIDAGIGDAFLASILLYLRYRRTSLMRAGALPAIGPAGGIAQLTLGAGAVIWTVKAF